ncbi:ParB-like protein [Collimonas sp. NPDC087041]|uniref:ParB-like protein n=1 Tax=Collimonas sp. NPDC087041 TaxID=3363960 RepID=UPI00381A2AC0
MHTSHPHLLEVSLKSLRPTQITVGLAEVEQKRLSWQNLSSDNRQSYLENHCFPGVLGPKGHYYIVDHHHLGLSLIEEQIETVKLIMLKDLSALNIDEFWLVMDHNQWVHPYDAKGQRCDFDAIPKKITKLVDDPYRSLAGEVRQAGGFPKDQQPFSEFIWADFFRRRIPLKMIRNQPSQALAEALQLSHSQAAAHLPGWSGQIVSKP